MTRRRLRVCLTPSCPTLVPGGGRCPSCQAEADRARGTTKQRGYGAEHKRLRAQWAPKVATGRVPCAKCRRLIPPGAPWDLGHVPGRRDAYAGPMCQACNRDTSDERGQQ